MNKSATLRQHVRGVTLVELLVAITLGAIIMAGAVTLFVNNRDTYKTTNELSRLQETARYALDMMVKDIRMAGYFGCADRLDTVSQNVAANTGDLWDFNMGSDPAAPIVPPIEGFEDAFPANEFVPSGFDVTVGNNGDGGEVLAGTDAITLRYIAGNMADVANGNDIIDYLVSDFDTSTSTITVDSTNGFAENGLAAIADCGGSDIFKIEDIQSQTVLEYLAIDRVYTAASPPLDKAGAPIIAPFVAVRYYIGNNQRGPGITPSLYRTTIVPDGAGNPQEVPRELFEGVERMHILFGVDEDNDGIPNRYVRSGEAPLRPPPTDPASNWANIVSVRIGIIVRTVDEHGRLPDTNTYTVNNVPFGPVGDRRRRRAFTTTAMVRNL